MAESIISEGKTTNEAIENGLKQLNASKSEVTIKVLESEKRSFFDILAPRIVKVEITKKEDSKKQKEIKELKTVELSEEEKNRATEKIKTFIDKIISNISNEITYEIEFEDNIVKINMHGKDTGVLIGYRGETLYAFQNIIQSVLNKQEENVIIRLDIENYKIRREKTLKDLAEKISKTVIKTKKSITLEPMQSYERKIIHAALQNNSRVYTESIGVEPNRRIVVKLKK